MLPSWIRCQYNQPLHHFPICVGHLAFTRSHLPPFRPLRISNADSGGFACHITQAVLNGGACNVGLATDDGGNGEVWVEAGKMSHVREGWEDVEPPAMMDSSCGSSARLLVNAAAGGAAPHIIITIFQGLKASTELIPPEIRQAMPTENDQIRLTCNLL